MVLELTFTSAQFLDQVRFKGVYLAFRRPQWGTSWFVGTTKLRRIPWRWLVGPRLLLFGR